MRKFLNKSIWTNKTIIDIIIKYLSWLTSIKTVFPNIIFSIALVSLDKKSKIIKTNAEGKT